MAPTTHGGYLLEELTGPRYAALRVTHVLRRVPIFAAHVRPEGTFDLAWLEAAASNAAAREASLYLPRLHLEHHDMGDAVSPAGYLAGLTVGVHDLDGVPTPTLFADLLLAAEGLAEVRAGRAPYLSVEVRDVESREITSAALLRTRAPYFKFPLIVPADSAPGLAAAAVGRRYVTPPLMWRREMPGDAVKPAEPVKAQEGEEAAAPEENPMLRQILDAISALAQQMAAKDGAAAAEQAEPVARPAEAKSEKRVAAAEPTDGAVRYAEATAKIVALEGRLRERELADEIEGEVRGLSDGGYAHDSDTTRTRMRAAAKEGIAPAKYAEIVKQHGFRAPGATVAPEAKEIEALPEGEAKWKREYAQAKKAGSFHGTESGYLAMRRHDAQIAMRGRSLLPVLMLVLMLVGMIGLGVAIWCGPPAEAALSANAPINIEVGTQNTYGVSASCTIYAGSMVGMQETGYCRALAAGDRFVGHAKAKVVEGTAADGGANVNVYSGVYRSQVTFTSIAVTDVGKAVFATDDATFVIDPADNASSRVGRLVRYVSSTSGVVEFDTTGHLSDGMIRAQDAAGTALTNTVTETALSTVTIPASSLQVGDVIHVHAEGIATSTSDSDTLTVKLYFGTEEIVTTGAVDVANNDIYVIDAYIALRAVGTSGQVVASGLEGLGVVGTVEADLFYKAAATESTAVDVAVAVKGTWSAADADNSVRSDVFVVEVLRAR